MLSNSKARVATIAMSVALALVLSGCQKEKVQNRTVRATPVGVQVVELSDVILYSELPGRTSAYQVAEVRPQVSGIILKRLFEEGSEVEEGQSLYQIDPAVYLAALAKAKASVAQAQANLSLSQADANRSARLVKTKAVSKQSNDSTQAQLKVARANLLAAKAAETTAEVNLRYTKVTSPISGRVSLSEVTPGALVTANQSARLTVVQQLDPIYVDVTQSYEALANLRKNLASGYLKSTGADEAKVSITLADGTKYPYTGRLTFKDALVDEATGTVRIRALFPNPDRTLLPGMFTRAKLVDGVREKVVQIDQKALLRHQDGAPYVLVVNKQKRVEIRNIKIQCANGTNWVLESGLAPGDVVITDGVLRVRPNDLVTYGGQKPAAQKGAK